MNTNNLFLFKFAQALFIAVWLLAEVQSQAIITCAQVNNTRTCSIQGYVSQRDVITVACTLDKSAPGSSNSAQLLVVLRNNTLLSSCPVPLNLCAGVANVDCNCVDNGSTYTVYLNRTAEPFLEEAKMTLSWRGVNNTSIIEAVRDPTLEEFTLNGKTIADKSDFRSCNSEIEKGSNVSYRCNSPLSPVVTNISNPNISKIGGYYVDIDGPQSGAVVYTFSSTICGIPAHSGSCTITIKPVITVSTTELAITTSTIQNTSSTGKGNITTETPTTTPGSSTTEKVVSDGDCDTTCIIIIVVVLVVVVCGAGIAVGVIYYWKKHGKIATCVIIVEVSATLIKVETLVIQEVERKEKKLPDCEKVIKYKGKKQDDKTIKLKSLVGEHEEVTVKVTVNVCRDGTFVLDEIVSVAVLEISVKASEPLGQLKDKVKTDVSKEHPGTTLDTLIFFLDGKTLNDMTKTLGVLFTGLEDGTMLTVIVHLDGSCKCEIKGPESTGSSSDSKLIKRPVSPPSLRYNEENKHTSEVETPREDKPRKKKKKRRGKTSPQGDNNGNDYTDAPSGTFENVQKSSKYDDEKPNDLDHGDYQHDSDEISRPLPKRSANNQSKDGNRTMQTSGFNVQQSPQDSRPTSIELTSAPRRLPKLTKKPK